MVEIANKNTNLLIIGAGPGGLTAALYAEKLGLDYLLIDRQTFPKDKICGDAIAPIVNCILRELNISDQGYANLCFQPKTFNFTFQSSDSQNAIVNEIDAGSKLFNCKRFTFDNFLFQALNCTSSFLCGTATAPDFEKKQIIITKPSGEKYCIAYEKLLIATGSGKALHGQEKGGIILASRFYVQTKKPVAPVNVIAFHEEIKPGYFWSFPVASNTYNTGIILHDKALFHELYTMHEEKLNECFGDYTILSRDKFPLRLHPFPGANLPDDVAIIGDAHHQIDPLFGHGIDTAMLEAREQVMHLALSGKFIKVTELLSLIEKRNVFSRSYSELLKKTVVVEDQQVVFSNFLVEINSFYQEVSNYFERVLKESLLAKNPQKKTWRVRWAELLQKTLYD
jgi:menaquinone-9 beta-reductase